MLTRLHVQNFKGLRDLTVSFGPLTVLVGPNGCGKSSVLGAIAALRNLILASPNGHIGPDFPAGTLSRVSDSQDEPQSIVMELECTTAGEPLSVDATLTPHAEYPTFLDVDRTSLAASKSDETYTKDWKDHRIPGWIASCFEHVEEYRLDAAVMSQPAYSEETRPALGTRGENLAAVLDALQGERREVFEAMEAELCGFIPGLRRVRLHRVSMPLNRQVLVGERYQNVRDSAVGHQVVLDFDFAKSIVADHASEGTLLLLGLLTIIAEQSGSPTTVMLDDLDRALHPKAQRRVVEHLHGLLKSRPELQIIATSHSPYLVEHLAYEEVLAMTQSTTDGRSLIAPLAEHPDAARWRDEMSAGEFWSTMGEQWITEERVAGE